MLPRTALTAPARTPAILLRSGAPDPHQRAGRRTFVHPVVAQVAIMDERVDGFRGAPQSVASHHFAERGADVGYFLERLSQELGCVGGPPADAVRRH